MKSSLFAKEQVEPLPRADFADVVSYARSEFRDGRSEREVMNLLVKSGHDRESIRGVVHELYFECLGVTWLDRAKDLLVKVIAIPIALFLLLKVDTTWVVGIVLLVALTVHVSVTSILFRRHWEKRYKARLSA